MMLGLLAAAAEQSTTEFHDTIIVAFFAMVGVLGAGFFGYLGVKSQVKASSETVQKRLDDLDNTNTDQHNANAKLIENMVDLITEHSVIVREVVNLQDRAIFRGDPNGELVSANPAALKLFGMSPTDMMSNGWLRAIRPDDQERVFEAWLKALGSKGIMGPISYHIVNQTTGNETYVECVSTPVVSRLDNELISWVSVVIPVTSEIEPPELAKSTTD